jgi:hypothetical protein
VASSTYTGAVYGTGVYGTDSYGQYGVINTVDGVASTGTVDPDVVIVGDATHSITSVQGVGAAGGVGDVTAASATTSPGVEGTMSAGQIRATSINIIAVSGVAGTGATTTSTVTADAGVTIVSTPLTGSAGDNFTFQSIYTLPSVSATGYVDEDTVPANNARPTFTGVGATGYVKHGNTSTTTVLFNVANKDHERTAVVQPDKPRIVYVRAA